MRVDLPVTGIQGQGRSLNSNPAAVKNAYIELNSAGEPRLVRRCGNTALLPYQIRQYAGVFRIVIPLIGLQVAAYISVQQTM